MKLGDKRWKENVPALIYHKNNQHDYHGLWADWFLRIIKDK